MSSFAACVWLASLIMTGSAPVAAWAAVLLACALLFRAPASAGLLLLLLCAPASAGLLLLLLCAPASAGLLLLLLCAPASAGLLLLLLCAPASAGLLLLLLCAPASAGAWTPAAGQGEIIATTLFDQSNSGFDQAGRFTPTPQYRSFQTTLYVDYGLTDWLAATLKPSLQSTTLGLPDNQKYTGLGDSEIGLRGRVWQSDTEVISVQGSVQLPTTAGPSNIALGDAKNADFDFRLLGGEAIAIGSLPGFIDISFGYRARIGPSPNEGRADLALGVYLQPELMLLLQSFNVLSAATPDPDYPRWGQSKTEASLVYAFNAEWRGQIGGFATLAGINTYREYGALLAVWRRF